MHLQVVQLLFGRRGVAVNATNTDGLTPLDVLLQQNRSESTVISGLRKILEDAGATGARLSSTTHVKNKPNLIMKNEHKENKHRMWLSERWNSLIVVAILIATITFDAGLRPPKGLNNEEMSGLNYGRFMLMDTIAFLVSLSAIILLISKPPFRPTVLMRVVVFIRFVIWFLRAYGILKKKETSAADGDIEMGIREKAKLPFKSSRRAAESERDRVDPQTLVFRLKNGVADSSRSASGLVVHERKKGSVFGHIRGFQALFAKGLHVAVTGSGGDRGFDPWRASLENEFGLQISSEPLLLLMLKGDNLIEERKKIRGSRLFRSLSKKTEEKGETVVHRYRLDRPAASHRTLRRSPDFLWQKSEKKKASWVCSLQRKDKTWDRFLFYVAEPWEGKGFIPIYGGFAERPRGDGD
ncbi:hypothetical protein MRB53_015043 [Persea americana]|uniref:Uncharacterized protein n=1 Tax=Persea americana TaxID=3435 RepID=A0ACC2KD03_PERAE|nr:hypothetical protein MRB53_015043 [Persea americana]